MADELRLKCAARNRQGGKCGRYPTHGSKRCHYHGGAKARIPKGDHRRGGPKHGVGIYRRFLLDNEKESYESAELGTFDHEIRLSAGC